MMIGPLEDVTDLRNLANLFDCSLRHLSQDSHCVLSIDSMHICSIVWLSVICYIKLTVKDFIMATKFSSKLLYGFNLKEFIYQC